MSQSPDYWGASAPRATLFPVRVLLIIALLGISGCSWFHRKPHLPPPSELVITGAPAGAVLLVDGTLAGQEAEAKKPQIFEVAPGTHVVEVKVGDTITYRENTYVAVGEKRLIQVLSGAR
jgi:hypothetical protein